MKYFESVSHSWSCLVAGVLGGVVVMGCGVEPRLYGNDETGPTVLGEGSSSTSGPGTTGAGGGTSEGSGGSSSSSGTGPMASTAESTCGGLGCETDLPAECDVFAQQCPEGEKCASIIRDGGGSWDSSRCVPVTGTDVAGDPCVAQSVAEGLDSCAEGFMCWGVDEQGMGTCVAQCMGDLVAPSCPNDGVCTIGGDGSLAVCLPYCDPLIQDCAEGAACYPLGDSFRCLADASGAAGEVNDPCELINVCAPGLFCAEPAAVGAGCPPGSLGCCTPFCEVPDGKCPDPDQQCLPWLGPDMMPVGEPWFDLGFCGVPQ